MICHDAVVNTPVTSQGFLAHGRGVCNIGLPVWRRVVHSSVSGVSPTSSTETALGSEVSSTESLLYGRLTIFEIPDRSFDAVAGESEIVSSPAGCWLPKPW